MQQKPKKKITRGKILVASSWPLLAAGKAVFGQGRGGAAMTYLLGGRQYIVTAIGGSYGAALVAFRLAEL
jgi:hypothetical protein